MSENNTSRLYNSTLKIKFIEKYTSKDTTSAYLISIFSTTSAAEYLYGCDVALLSSEKLQVIFNDNFGIRERARLYVLKVLRDYVEWYYNYNENPEQAKKIISMYKNNQQGIWGVKLKNTDKVRQKMVSSPKELLDFLDSIFEEPKEKTVSSIYRSFLWLAYIGISDIDSVKIKISDVDLKKKIIDYNGKIYNIFEESIPDLKNACELDEFVYIHKNPFYESSKPRLPGDTLIRGIGEASTDIHHIRTHIWRTTKKYNSLNKEDASIKMMSPTYRSLMLSGLFYRAYMLEINGENFDKEIQDFVNKKNEDKISNNNEYKLSGYKSIDIIKKDNINELIKDYECWKVVFDK